MTRASVRVIKDSIISWNSYLKKTFIFTIELEEDNHMCDLQVQMHTNMIIFVIRVDSPAGIFLFRVSRGGSGFFNAHSSAIKTIMFIFCSTQHK